MTSVLRYHLHDPHLGDRFLIALWIVLWSWRARCVARDRVIAQLDAERSDPGGWGRSIDAAARERARVAAALGQDVTFQLPADLKLPAYR